mgnify:CR=1 FL=1
MNKQKRCQALINMRNYEVITLDTKVDYVDFFNKPHPPGNSIVCPTKLKPYTTRNTQQKVGVAIW